MEVEKIEQFLKESQFRNLFVRALYYTYGYKEMPSNIKSDKTFAFERYHFQSGFAGRIDRFNLRIKIQRVADSKDLGLLWSRFLEKEEYFGEVLTSFFGFEMRSSHCRSFSESTQPGYDYLDEPRINITIPAIITLDQVINSNFFKAVYNLWK